MENAETEAKARFAYVRVPLIEASIWLCWLARTSAAHQHVFPLPTSASGGGCTALSQSSTKTRRSASAPPSPPPRHSSTVAKILVQGEPLQLSTVFFPCFIFSRLPSPCASLASSFPSSPVITTVFVLRHSVHIRASTHSCRTTAARTRSSLKHQPPGLPPVIFPSVVTAAIVAFASPKYAEERISCPSPRLHAHTHASVLPLRRPGRAALASEPENSDPIRWSAPLISCPPCLDRPTTALS